MHQEQTNPERRGVRPICPRCPDGRAILPWRWLGPAAFTAHCESCIIAHHNWTVVFKHRWEAKELPQGGRGGKTLDGGNPLSLPKQHACSGQQLGWGFYEDAMHLLTCSKLSGRRREQRMQVCKGRFACTCSASCSTSCWAERGQRRAGGNLDGVLSKPMGQNSLSVMALAYWKGWLAPVVLARPHCQCKPRTMCADVDQLFSFWSKPFMRRLLVGTALYNSTDCWRKDLGTVFNGPCDWWQFLYLCQRLEALDGRKQGRKEGSMEGRNERRKQGMKEWMIMKEGRKQGMTERKKGRKQGMKEGKNWRKEPRKSGRKEEICFLGKQ